MTTTILLHDIQSAFLEVRGHPVLLDSDAACVYGVETKRVNEAVRNNPNKFPAGYMLELKEHEWKAIKKNLESSEMLNLRSKISTANYSKVRTPPKVFTERGLYMLATILKSKVAAEATIAIIEAYANLRELSKTIGLLSESEDLRERESLIKRSGVLLTDLLDDQLPTSDSETSIELNLALLKFKHSVKRSKNT